MWDDIYGILEWVAPIITNLTLITWIFDITHPHYRRRLRMGYKNLFTRKKTAAKKSPAARPKSAAAAAVKPPPQVEKEPPATQSKSDDDLTWWQWVLAIPFLLLWGMGWVVWKFLCWFFSLFRRKKRK